MNRNFIGGLLAGLFTSIAVAAQAQPAWSPPAELALGFIPAVLSQQGALSGSNARTPQSLSVPGAVSTADAAGVSVRVAGARQPQPPCGCIPRPGKNCPDRFCNPT